MAKKSSSKTKLETKTGLTERRRSALILAAIGIGLLGLSVTHCTEAISLLTGSRLWMSALLAIGIDAGMVAMEWASLTSHKAKNGVQVQRGDGVHHRHRVIERFAELLRFQPPCCGRDEDRRNGLGGVHPDGNFRFRARCGQAVAL